MMMAEVNTMMTPVLTSLNHDKILRALQITDREQMTETLDAQIRRCEAVVLRCAVPRSVIRILTVREFAPLFQGNDIARLLDGCGEVVLMALTIGTEVERRLMREEVTNMSNAYLLDVCASQAVEEAADDLEQKLREKILGDGKYLTNRFSPGYGDYPIALQRMVLEYLNAGRAIGLTLTSSGLMVPRKSITAVMGISEEPKPDVYGTCSNCPLLTKCSFREHGTRCYHQVLYRINHVI